MRKSHSVRSSDGGVRWRRLTAATIATACLIVAGGVAVAAPAGAAPLGERAAATTQRSTLTVENPVRVDPGEPARLRGTGTPDALIVVSTATGFDTADTRVSYGGDWELYFPFIRGDDTLRVEQYVDGQRTGTVLVDVIVNSYPVWCAAPTAILSRSDSAGRTQLFVRDLSSPDAPEQPFTAPWPGNGFTDQFNAMGYDRDSRQIYSIANAYNVDTPRELIVTDGRGISRSLGIVHGLPQNRFINSGTIFDGALWVTSQGAPEFYRVDLTTLYAEPHAFTGTWASSDWTEAGLPGVLWGHNLDGFQRLDLATGRVDDFRGPSIPSNAAGAGGMFTYPGGDLGLVSDSGTITRVQVSDETSSTPTFTVVSTTAGSPGEDLDATSCLP